MDIKSKFGGNVKFFRDERRLSQEKLARIAGVDRTYISSIELGKRNVSISMAEKLSKALSVEISDLLQ